MLRDHYKEEMKDMGPSDMELNRLMTMLVGGSTERRSPFRWVKRRGAVLLAACALLVVTALAAGSAIWPILQSELGPFFPYLSQPEEVAEDQGLRMTLEGSLSDGLQTKLYVSVTDLTGNRLDERTRTDIRVDGTWLGNIIGSSIKRLPNGYDPESKTVLYEVTYSGLDFTRPIAIEATSFQPQCYNFNGVYPDLTGLTDQVLPSEIGPEGQVILAKGTQPQTFPELPGLSLTMGVASDGIFHVRWWLEEGYAGRSLLAMPTSQASGENYQSEYDVHSDLTDGGDISYPALPANLVADIKSLELYGSYRGPAPAIEGEWTLENIQLEQVETKVIRDCGTYGVFVIDSIQISPLGVSVIYRNTPGDAGVFTWQHECTVHLADGTDAIPGAPNAPWSADKTNYAFWSFENPVELDQVSALSLFGHKFTF